MFHFPRCPPRRYGFAPGRSDLPSKRVSPFGYSRIKGCLPPPRDFSQAATSFIGFLCRGIHRLLLVYALAPPKRENVLSPRHSTKLFPPPSAAGYPFDFTYSVVNDLPTAPPDFGHPLGVSGQRRRRCREKKTAWVGPSGMPRTHGVLVTAWGEFDGQPHKLAVFSRVNRVIHRFSRIIVVQARKAVKGLLSAGRARLTECPWGRKLAEP